MSFLHSLERNESGTEFDFSDISFIKIEPPTLQLCRPLNSHGFNMCLTVSLPFSRSHGSFFISHGFTNFEWIFPNTQFLWEQAQAAHSNVAEGRISCMINKNKAGSCSSPSSSWALLFNILVKTHTNNPLQCTPSSDLLKIAKICTAKYNRELSSKYWSILAVFHTVDFCSWRFSCWSFKTKAVSCDNIQTALRKTFMSKCDINFFQIKLTSSSYVFLGVFLLFWGFAPGMHLKWWWWCLFYVCNDLLQQINIRSSLPEGVPEKACSLYIRGPSWKTKGFY